MWKPCPPNLFPLVLVFRRCSTFCRLKCCISLPKYVGLAKSHPRNEPGLPTSLRVMPRHVRGVTPITAVPAIRTDPSVELNMDKDGTRPTGRTAGVILVHFSACHRPEPGTANPFDSRTQASFRSSQIEVGGPRCRPPRRTTRCRGRRCAMRAAVRLEPGTRRRTVATPHVRVGSTCCGSPTCAKTASISAASQVSSASITSTHPAGDAAVTQPIIISDLPVLG